MSPVYLKAKGKTGRASGRLYTENDEPDFADTARGLSATLRHSKGQIIDPGSVGWFLAVPLNQTEPTPFRNVGKKRYVIFKARNHMSESSLLLIPFEEVQRGGRQKCASGQFQ
jgi:hypothetical protein